MQSRQCAKFQRENASAERARKEAKAKYSLGGTPNKPIPMKQFMIDLAQEKQMPGIVKNASSITLNAATENTVEAMSPRDSPNMTVHGASSLTAAFGTESEQDLLHQAHDNGWAQPYKLAARSQLHSSQALSRSHQRII